MRDCRLKGEGLTAETNTPDLTRELRRLPLWANCASKKDQNRLLRAKIPLQFTEPGPIAPFACRFHLVGLENDIVGAREWGENNVVV